MVNEPARHSRPRAGLAVSGIVLICTAVALIGCGRKSVVGSVTGAAANVAGAAVSTTASVAGTAASTTASAAGSAASAASSAATAGGSSSVLTTPVAVGAGLVGLAAAADADANDRDPATFAEGVANCLRAGPKEPATTTDLLTQAGWLVTGSTGDRTNLMKGNVEGYVLADGNCVFTSKLVTVTPVDPKVREVVENTFPKAKVKKPANKGDGLCDGFTLRQSRKNQAWIHYTDANGNACNGYGAGVVVQFQ